MAIRGQTSRGITPEQAAQEKKLERKSEEEYKKQVAEQERLQDEAEQRQKSEWEAQQREWEQQQEAEAKAEEEKAIQDFLTKHPKETHYILWKDGVPFAYEVPQTVHEYGGREIWELDVRRTAVGWEPRYYAKYLKEIGRSDTDTEQASFERLQIKMGDARAIDIRLKDVDQLSWVETEPTSVSKRFSEPGTKFYEYQPRVMGNDLKPISFTPPSKYPVIDWGKTTPQELLKEFKPWEIQYVVDTEDKKVGLQYLQTLSPSEKEVLAREYVSQRPEDFFELKFKERDPKVYKALEPSMLARATDLLMMSPEEYTRRFYDTRTLPEQIAISSFPTLTGTIAQMAMLPVTIVEEVGGRVFTGKPVEINPLRKPIAEFHQRALQTGPSGLIGTSMQYGVGWALGKPEAEYAGAWERSKQHPIPALFATGAEIAGMYIGGKVIKAEFIGVKKTATVVRGIPTTIKTIREVSKYGQTDIVLSSRMKKALEFMQDTKAQQPILALKQEARYITPQLTVGDILRDPSLLNTLSPYDPAYIQYMQMYGKSQYANILGQQAITTTALKLEPRIIGVSSRLMKAKEMLGIQTVVQITPQQKLARALAGQTISRPAETKVFDALRTYVETGAPKAAKVISEPYIKTQPYIMQNVANVVAPQPMKFLSSITTVATFTPILITKEMDAYDIMSKTSTKTITKQKTIAQPIIKTINIPITITKTKELTITDTIYDTPIITTKTKTKLMHDLPQEITELGIKPQLVTTQWQDEITKLKMPPLPENNFNFEDPLSMPKKRKRKKGARYRIHPIELMRIV